VEEEGRATDLKAGHATKVHSSVAPSAALYQATAASASGTISITEITGGKAYAVSPDGAERSFGSSVMPTACRTLPAASPRSGRQPDSISTNGLLRSLHSPRSQQPERLRQASEPGVTRDVSFAISRYRGCCTGAHRPILTMVSLSRMYGEK
jgi:hypothetical protein